MGSILLRLSAILSITAIILAAGPDAQAARIRTSTTEVDHLKGAPMTSIVLQITANNVRVDDQPFAQYAITLQSSFAGGAPSFVLSELGNGFPLSSKNLSGKVDFRTLFYGATGAFVLPTNDPADMRVVRSLAGPLVLTTTLTMQRDPGKPGFIEPDDGSGPLSSWSKQVQLSGQDVLLGTLLVETGNGIQHSSAQSTQQVPAVSAQSLELRYDGRSAPTVKHAVERARGSEDIVEETESGLGKILRRTLPGRVGNVIDALHSMQDNLEYLEEGLAELTDPILRDILAGSLATKIFLLLRCIELGGIKGKMNNDAFDECVDEIDDLSDVVDDEEPGPCVLVCADPTFSTSRCTPGTPGSFNDIDIMDELCDVYRDLRSEVTAEDSSASALAALAEMESQLETLMQAVWDKSKAFCGCP
jgi:hypothetical protein